MPVDKGDAGIETRWEWVRNTAIGHYYPYDLRNERPKALAWQEQRRGGECASERVSFPLQPLCAVLPFLVVITSMMAERRAA